MTECEAVVARHQHVVAHRCAECIGELRLWEPGGRRQQPVVHAPAARRCDPHHGLRAGVECGDSRQQRVAQRRGQSVGRPALGDGHQLLGEERVALRASEDGLDELLRRWGAEDRRDLLAHLGVCQSRQLEPLGCGRGGNVGQEAPQPGAPADLVAAIGRDDQDALAAQASGKEGQQVEGRRSAQWRSSTTSSTGAAADARSSRSSTSACRRATGPAANCALADPAAAAPPSPDACRVAIGVEVAQRVGHRQQRDRRLLEARALPPEHAAPSSAARAASSASSLLLPIPASPPTSTTIGTPSAACSMAATSSPSSPARPAKTRLDRRCVMAPVSLPRYLAQARNTEPRARIRSPSDVPRRPAA